VYGPCACRRARQDRLDAKTEDLPNEVKLTVTTNDPKQVIKLKALGFKGIMVQGGHHQPHHPMMVKGEFPMR
jgi:hypothetical protein